MSSFPPSMLELELVTPRLRLRPAVETDAERFGLLVNDREIAANTRSIPYPYPPGAALDWIREHRTRLIDGQAVALAMHRRDPNSESGLIGVIGLHLDSEHHHAELGYWLGRDYWNQGFASESAAALIEFGFETLGLHRIYAHHLTRNPASGRVMIKCGMRYEGCLRGHSRKWGVFEDIALYGMLHSDPRPGQPGHSDEKR